MNDLAVIVLNYKSYNDSERCLKQLLSFQGCFHIILVDNQSPDDSFKRLKECFKENFIVDFIQTERNGGYSAGNNFGIKYAIEKYQVNTIAILNPDVFIPKYEVLKVMKEKLYTDDSYAIIGGSVIDAGNQYVPILSAWDIPSKMKLVFNHSLFRNRKRDVPTMKIIGEKLAQVECVAGCFFMAKVSHLQKLGFLDENVFLYNEENILGIKCKEAGLKEVLALDQFYYHIHKRNEKQNITFKQKMQTTKNAYISRCYLCKKYYRSKGLFLLGIVEFFNKVYLFLSYIKKKVIRKKRSKR